MDMEFLFRRLDFARHGIFSRLTDRWKGPDQPLVIGLALQVGGCHWLRPADTVIDRQSHQDEATADPIERSPPETTERFEHWVPDFTDDFGRL